MSCTGHDSGARLLRRMMLLGVLCLCIASAASHTPAVLPAESVKAAFVFRFAGYVTWPEDAVPPGKFTIAVLGANQVAVDLQTLLARRSLLNRPVQVRRIADIRDAAGTQILYVGRDHRGDLRSLLSPLAGRSTLIITDEGDALAAGSTINLLLADQRIRFEISQAAAAHARLKISSDLLALAVRVVQ